MWGLCHGGKQNNLGRVGDKALKSALKFCRAKRTMRLEVKNLLLQSLLS